MALAINNNISALHLNAGALAELNKVNSKLAIEGARISSGNEGESIRKPYSREDMLRELRENSVAPDEIRADRGLDGDLPTHVEPRIDSSVISQLKQRPFDLSALDRYNSIQLFYGYFCDAIRMENGVNDLVAAQQTGTSIINNTLSNQAAVMSGVGGGASLTAVEGGVGRGTSLASAQSGVGRGTSLASAQSGVGRGTSLASAQSGVGRGTSVQALGGEKGNIALLAQNYNQLMRVDLNNAAVSATQNATATQSVLRLF